MLRDKVCEVTPLRHKASEDRCKHGLRSAKQIPQTGCTPRRPNDLTRITAAKSDSPNPPPVGHPHPRNSWERERGRDRGKRRPQGRRPLPTRDSSQGEHGRRRARRWQRGRDTGASTSTWPRRGGERRRGGKQHWILPTSPPQTRPRAPRDDNLRSRLQKIEDRQSHGGRRR